jgi:hypothetical protein
MTYDRKELIRSFFNTLPKEHKADWLRRRRACDASLFYFIKDVGGSMPKQGGDITPFVHKPICDNMQDRAVLRFFYYMPRGWRKSTIGRWHWIWEWTQDNEIRMLVPSEKQATASTWVKDTGDQILRNDRLRWLYPELQVIDQSYIKSHRWSSQYLELPRLGIYPEPTLAVTGIRSAAQGGHYDLITPDDLVGEKGYESPVVMEDAFRWFDNIEELLVEPDMSKPGASRIVGRGTHWNKADLGIYIQDKYQDYKWMIVPALKDEGLVDTDMVTWVQNEDVGNGESNWPEVFSTRYYLDMLANPEKEVVFYAQHQNNPRESTALNKFDGNWIRWYEIEEEERLSGPPEKWIICDDGQRFRIGEFNLWGFIDPGGFAEMRLQKKGSRNAILIGGQPRESMRKFVLDTWAGRLLEPSKFLDRVFDMQDLWHIRAWMVETVGAQKYIFRDIQQEKRLRKRALTIVEMPPDTSRGAKDSDILALMAPFQNGEIFLHRRMKELIGEIRSYPTGLTVDLLDMLGKINRYRWTRRKPDEIRAYGRPAPPPALAGVSPVTGY